MDSDIIYIIEEEGKLVKQLESARQAARERIEEKRKALTAQKESELSRIAEEFSRMKEVRLTEIKSRMDKELKEAHDTQERVLNDAELEKKITGRIVSVILENRT
ncbi:MAG TPA: hypothetical protein PK358_05385 [Spirochaetota bacterium]|nr:hypothetical protein [Spirochaetota bacterium]HPJ34248.1 hypothetical protein [Spirochaetota bacterium]